MQKYPYRSQLSWTTIKQFKPSFNMTQTKEFVLDQLARAQGIEPRLTESKSAVLPLDDAPTE